MVRLERLAIRKYRRLAPGTELRFSPHHNVLLGKNASGKTTLLDLIACVVSLDFSNLRDEAFDVEFEFWDGETRLLSMELRNVANDMAAPGLNNASHGRPYGASATIKLADDSSLVVTNRGTEVTRPNGEKVQRAPLALFDPGLRHEVEPTNDEYYFPNAIADMSPAVRVDEGLAVFDSIVGGCMLRYLRAADGDVRWFPFGLWPLDTIEGDLVAAKIDRLNVNESLVLDAPSIPILQSLAHAMGLGAVEVLLDATRSSAGWSELSDLRFRCTRRDGSIDTNSTLSYGERRMIALWWCLACTPHVAVIDELVNGLHHSWIEATMRRLDGRQSFLTSQNPLLMDYLGFGSADDVQRTFMLCAGLSGTSSDLPIRNLTSEEASRFYAAHAVGIQHVSEILRDQGLW
jgi:energy-coupling factor transporter ATP-binding protein EcfA2